MSHFNPIVRPSISSRGEEYPKVDHLGKRSGCVGWLLGTCGGGVWGQAFSFKHQTCIQPSAWAFSASGTSVACFVSVVYFPVCLAEQIPKDSQMSRRITPFICILVKMKDGFLCLPLAHVHTWCSNRSTAAPELSPCQRATH